MRKNLAIALFLLVGLVGCEMAPRLDCSNQAAFEKSLQAVGESLPDSEKAEFGLAMMQVTARNEIPNLFKAALHGQNPLSKQPAEMFKSVHGLTGRQVIAKAKAMREGQ